MSYAVGVNEVAVHALCDITGSYTVEAVGVNERVALHHLYAVLERLGTQFLVIIVLRCFHEEVATHNRVHQHRDATALTRFTDELCQIIVER